MKGDFLREVRTVFFLRTSYFWRLMTTNACGQLTCFQRQNNCPRFPQGLFFWFLRDINAIKGFHVGTEKSMSEFKLCGAHYELGSQPAAYEKTHRENQGEAELDQTAAPPRLGNEALTPSSFWGPGPRRSSYSLTPLTGYCPFCLYNTAFHFVLSD